MCAYEGSFRQFRYAYERSIQAACSVKMINLVRLICLYGKYYFNTMINRPRVPPGPATVAGARPRTYGRMSTNNEATGSTIFLP
jgi:hypothetical protein